MTMRRRSEAGVSILEIMIALVVLAVGVLMLMSLMISSNKLQQDGREKAIAYNAARQKIEEMRTWPVGEIYQRYNARTADNLSGTNPGSTFDVSGLNPPKTGNRGEIFFPEDNNDPTLATALSELPPSQSLMESLGMYTPPLATAKLNYPAAYGKDINRDGDKTDTAVAGADVTLLPVLIRIRWETQGGKVSSIDMATMISDRGN